MVSKNKMPSRLSSQAVFSRLRASEQKWITPAFVVHILQDEKIFDPVMAITVSRKASQKAVDRVRMRRRLRALAHDILPLHAKRGAIIGLTARQEALSRNFEALKKDLLWALRKLDMIVE
jgi:ribonuclease P protein component